MTTTSVNAGPGGAAGGETDDHRDLRDVAGRADHGFEHLAYRVQRPHTFSQPGTTRMPDAHDGTLVFDGSVVGVDDVRAPLDAHGAAHHGAVGAERDGAHTVDGARRGQHSGAVTLVQQFHAAVVEEVAQPQQRIAGSSDSPTASGAMIVIAGLLSRNAGV